MEENRPWSPEAFENKDPSEKALTPRFTLESSWEQNPVSGNIQALYSSLEDPNPLAKVLSNLAETENATLPSLSDNNLFRLTIILNKIRDEWAAGRLSEDSVEERANFIGQLYHVVQLGQDAMYEPYFQWLSRPREFLQTLAPAFPRVGARTLSEAIDAMLSMELYAKIALDEKNFRLYKGIWEDISTLLKTNSYFARNTSEIAKRFRDLFWNHDFLMRTFFRIPWPHLREQGEMNGSGT